MNSGIFAVSSIAAPGVSQAAAVRPGTLVQPQASSGIASFEDTLKEVAASAVGTLKSAEVAAALGVKGELPAQQVVQSILAAEHTLQTAIAVRDKVVAAYLELSRMQI